MLFLPIPDHPPAASGAGGRRVRGRGGQALAATARVQVVVAGGGRSLLLRRRSDSETARRTIRLDHLMRHLKYNSIARFTFGKSVLT